MKRLVQLGVLAAVLLLCIATNPSQARHQQQIKKAFRKEGGLFGKLGLGGLYAHSFKYDNLLLCSFTSAEGEVKSFGVLGMVFTF